jgi:hypothetical protein
MRKPRLSLLATVLCVALSPALLRAQDKPLELTQRQQQMVAGKYAVVVGINDYASEDISDLRFCESDAQSFADVLRSTCGYGGHVVTLLGKDARGELILKTLRNLADPRFVPQRDTVVFYFSGHGAVLDGQNYLVPVDGSADPDYVKQYNLRVDDIAALLKQGGFARQVLFLDACRNELRADGKSLGGRGLVQFNLAEQFAKGLKVLLGTEFGQISREDEALGHGLFTYYLVEGLKGAAADDAGLITVGQLEGYVLNEMAAYSLQNPAKRQVPVSAGEGSSAIPLAVVSLGSHASGSLTPPPQAPVTPATPPAAPAKPPAGPAPGSGQGATAEASPVAKAIYEKLCSIVASGDAEKAESKWRFRERYVGYADSGIKVPLTAEFHTYHVSREGDQIGTEWYLGGLAMLQLYGSGTGSTPEELSYSSSVLSDSSSFTVLGQVNVGGRTWTVTTPQLLPGSPARFGRLLLYTTDLQEATPATDLRFGVVYCTFNSSNTGVSIDDAASLLAYTLATAKL